MNRTTFSLPALAAALCTLGAAFATTSALADAPAPAAKPAKARAWVQAPRKHNGPSVRLSYSVPAQLAVSQAASVRLMFEGVAQDDTRVSIKSPDGSVSVTQADGSATTDVALPRGHTTLIDLRVTPSIEGLHYIDVFTSQGAFSGVQSVPLKVGSGKLQFKPNGTVQTTPSGERVISLPAKN